MNYPNHLAGGLDTIRELFRHGEELYKDGDYKSAVKPLVTAVNRYERVNPKLYRYDSVNSNLSEVANCYHLLGVIYYHIGQTGVSIRNLRKAVELRETMDPQSIDLSNSLRLSNSLHFLSRAHSTQGEHEQSSILAERSFMIRERTRSIDACLESLALLAEEKWWLTGDYEKAMQPIRRAEALACSYTRHESVLHSKGLIHLEVKKYDEAASLLSDAMKMYSKLPDGNVDVAECLGNLALAKVGIGLTFDALNVLEKGRKMCLKWAPKESMAYITILRLEGQVKHRTGNLFDAIRCYREGLRYLKEVRAPATSIDRRKIEEGLALVEIQLNRLQFSEPNHLRGTGTRSQPKRSYKQVMICYTGKSDFIRNFVPFLEEALKAAGLDPFIDYVSLTRGDYYPNELREQVSHCKVFILMWSRHFPYQPWCNQELDWALDAGCTILPIFMDSAKLYPSSDWIRWWMKYKFNGKLAPSTLDRWCDNMLLLDKIHRLENQSMSRDNPIQMREQVIKDVQAALMDNEPKDYRKKYQLDASHHRIRAVRRLPATSEGSSCCRKPIMLRRALVLFLVAALIGYWLAPVGCQVGCGLRGGRRQRCGSKGRTSLCYDKQRSRRKQLRNY